MKKKWMVLCAVMMSIISLFGCGAKENARDNDNEVKKVSKLAGVVKECNEDFLRIQLCGNLFRGSEKYCYIETTNEYEALKINDSVIISYAGELKYESKEEFIEAKGIEVISVESFENDGEFIAYLGIDNCVDEYGEEYSLDDPNCGVCYCITPAEGEPEAQFSVYYLFSDEERINVQIDKDWTVAEPVTVTYDLDTMKVISIIQD